MLDEPEPAPNGITIADVDAEQGSHAASPAEIAEFERLHGPSLPPDGER